MTVTVKYFGLLTDITQTNEEQFLLDETVLLIHQLKNKILQKYPSINGVNFTIALNQTIVKQDSKLNNHDIIALLPPFAGG